MRAWRVRAARPKGATGLQASVLGPAAQCDLGVREAALARGAQLARQRPGPPAEQPSEELRPLIDTVARHAYRLTDEELAAAGAAGYGEEELFEIIIATSLGAGLARREIGLAAIAASETR